MCCQLLGHALVQSGSQLKVGEPARLTTAVAPSMALDHPNSFWYSHGCLSLFLALPASLVRTLTVWPSESSLATRAVPTSPVAPTSQQYTGLSALPSLNRLTRVATGFAESLDSDVQCCGMHTSDGYRLLSRCLTYSSLPSSSAGMCGSDWSLGELSSVGRKALWLSTLGSQSALH